MSQPTPAHCGESVLVVDADSGQRESVAHALGQAGYAVGVASDGPQALAAVAASHPALVLLELALPGSDGWQVLETLRAEGFEGGVIVLTGQEDTETLVRALARGADDFVRKPYVLRELLARIHAVLRRTQRTVPAKRVRLGDVEIDLEARSTHRGAEAVALTATEYKLIEQLAVRRGRTVTREELLTRVWGYSASACTRTVDTHVWRLRGKVCDDPHHPRWLVTTPGGYRLNPPDQPEPALPADR